MLLPVPRVLLAARSRRAIILAGAVLGFATAAGADDRTFREFPDQQAPSPEQLARLLSALQAQSAAVDRDSDSLRNLAPGFPSDPSRLTPEQRRWIEQLLERSGISLDPQTRAAIDDWSRNRNPAERSATERPRANPAKRPERAGHQAEQPSPERPSGRSQSSRPGAGIDFERAAELLARRSGERGPSGSGRGPDAEELRRRAEALARGFAERGGSPSIRPPQRRDNTHDRRSGSDPANWQSEFGGEWNRILMAAAERASNVGAPSFDAPAAEAPLAEKFVDSLVGRVHKMIEDRPAEWNGRPSRSGSRGRDRTSDATPGFPWNIRWPHIRTPNPGAVPGGSTAYGGEFQADADQLWLAAVPAGVGVVLLGAAVWLRRRGSSRGNLQQRPVSFDRVESPEDLVQAVDLLLISRYGSQASWWDCRAVERGLILLRPDVRRAMVRLASDYRRARYAPRRCQLSAVQLAHSARMLRRLATSSESSRKGVRPLHSAA